MKRILASTILIYMIVFNIVPFFVSDYGIDNNAARLDKGFDCVYIEDNIIPMSENMNTNTYLKSLAINTYNETNCVRESYGLDTLDWDQDLESCATIRAQECSEVFSHTRPNGKDWYTINSNIMNGENLAYGYNDAESIVNAWMQSPTHRDNILYDDFNSMSVAVYKTDDGTMYWAQEFEY